MASKTLRGKNRFFCRFIQSPNSADVFRKNSMFQSCVTHFLPRTSRLTQLLKPTPVSSICRLYLLLRLKGGGGGTMYIYKKNTQLRLTDKSNIAEYYKNSENHKFNLEEAKIIHRGETYKRKLMEAGEPNQTN